MFNKSVLKLIQFYGRFNALEFLIMLVGDSIMRNQWESLVCLVQSVVPAPRKTLIYNGPTMAFLALV